VYPTSRMLAWEDGWGCSLRSNGQTDVYGVSYQKIWEIYGNVRDFSPGCAEENLRKGKAWANQMARFVGAGSWDENPCGMKTCDFSQIRSSQLGAGSWEKIRIG
jgi:hypothetical protein